MPEEKQNEPLDIFYPKFREVVIQKFDYDRIWLVKINFKSHLGVPYTANEVELRYDMDYKLIAEKFRRLATQIEKGLHPC